MSRRVFQEIAGLTTESIHPDADDLDRFSIGQILRFMSAEDAKVAAAVKAVLPQVETAVESILDSFRRGGRLIYIGAGTSGRLGIIDAAECPPTFGSDPRQVVGLIAGGREAVFLSKEGAEDNAEQGEKDLKNIALQSEDTLVGIASSSRTPYVLGALQYARTQKAATVLVMCNPVEDRAGRSTAADVIIAPVLGPEIVMGSTRLKAGTATKMILNMMTTAAFIRSGKVYKGMMVDLQAWSEKLKARSRRVLMLATGLDYERAGEFLQRAEGALKTAIVMALCGVEKDEAEALLQRANGFVRRAIAGASNAAKDTRK